jgi:hypothetical protein
MRHVLAVCFHALLCGMMRPVEFRDTLFGDVPLSSWVREPRPCCVSLGLVPPPRGAPALSHGV